jgi:3-oxoacyl-[acyl-carrier protein] reductase
MGRIAVLLRRTLDKSDNSRYERACLAQAEAAAGNLGMNKIDLQGQNAVVTGAARGIGFAIVQRLLASGARCSLWDVDREALNIAMSSLDEQGEFDMQAVDITRPDAVGAATDSTIRRFGSIAILVNNAGIAGVSKKLWECTPEEWFQVLNLDLYAVYLCCHAIVPKMLEKKYGRIVNIASIAGKEGNPNASHYSAAKAGVIGLTKSLGKELAQSGVIVNCVTPAVIETDILKQVSQEHVAYMVSRIPMGRPGFKEEVAALVAWLCSSECSFSTGAVFDISGGRATY